MALYPIRCCCQPEKIFGYLELPDALVDGRRINLPEARMVRAGHGELQSAPIHTIELRRYRKPSESIDEIAVYSDDRPAEFWPRLSGFRPLDPVDRR